MNTLRTVNQLIGILFALCYFYQFVYIPVSWFLKSKKADKTGMTNRYAILICARNEENVIAGLIESLKHQTYDQRNLQIFVMADNCTDHTASIAEAAGAVVYERRDQALIGKGYALELLLQNIAADHPEGFDGYFVFDADNVLRSDFIEQMDRVFSGGHDIVTSYRNSKNFGDNWLSAGYALWYLRESRYLNHARFLLGASCAVSGTGFLFSRKVLEETGGWPFHMLVEDIEFSIDQIVQDKKIAFCKEAELYDEQPTTFSQSWRQRMRWARGYWQVFKAYGLRLIKGIFRGNFSCFDMSMSIMPAFILSTLSIINGIALGIWDARIGGDVMIAVTSIAYLFGEFYAALFVMGLITTITECGHIHTETIKKILYVFTFPLFIFTYIPIALVSLFVDPGWKPIRHSTAFDPEDIRTTTDDRRE
ncbi:MAG: glycosyltransferase family 2 protein [Flexilinea sp.]|nr:glycosyltransferase family 2 protein [Flexilinea sp.]